jgi:hypothetical protein
MRSFLFDKHTARNCLRQFLAFSTFFLKKSCKKTTRPFLGDPLEARRGNKISRATRFCILFFSPTSPNGYPACETNAQTIDPSPNLLPTRERLSPLSLWRGIVER